MFGDPNAEANAEAELDTLRMRSNQKFTDFLVEFNSVVGQIRWNEESIRYRLRASLPSRIKETLALVEEPRNLDEFKRVVQSIDRRYWERQAEARREGMIPRAAPNSAYPPRVPYTPTPRVPAPPPRNPPQNTSAASRAATPRPQQPLRHLTPQGSLTAEERERRIAQNLCLYCGKEGHKAAECNKARKNRETQGRATMRSEMGPPEDLMDTSVPTADLLSGKD